jgi:hypothetical protein
MINIGGELDNKMLVEVDLYHLTSDQRLRNLLGTSSSRRLGNRLHTAMRTPLIFSNIQALIIEAVRSEPKWSLIQVRTNATGYDVYE